MHSLLLVRLSLLLGLIFACCGVYHPLLNAEPTIYLRDNLRKAQSGDFIVTAQGQTYTLLHIYEKKGEQLVIEEITVPTNRIPKLPFAWQMWLDQGAQGNTSWVMYVIDLQSGHIHDYYSISRQGWCDVSQADNFLSKLLGLQLTLIPLKERRKVGPTLSPGAHDWRPAWQPKVVYQGREIGGVRFNAWRTRWPKDGSPLSCKLIEVYLPEDHTSYPSYFPYWLQVSGVVGKAKVRIIDSGNGLRSPARPIPSRV